MDKGLCQTCVSDTRCIFQKGFAVLQCEEFSNANHTIVKTKHLIHKKNACLEEVTTEE